jgi:hypothetical protein
MHRRGQFSDAAYAHEHNAKNHVVHVQRASANVAWPPPHLGADESHGQPDGNEADHKCYEKAEQWQSPGMNDLRMEPA